MSPALEAQSLNHWTAREVPMKHLVQCLANNKPLIIVTFEVVITLSSYLNGLLGRVLRQ